MRVAEHTKSYVVTSERLRHENLSSALFLHGKVSCMHMKEVMALYHPELPQVVNRRLLTIRQER